MNWITNKLLSIIGSIWMLWVCLFGRADMDAPFAKWLVKCWEAKERSGEIAWNEFLAFMKYLTLHYVQNHDEAEKPYNYSDLVDMTPFVDDGYTEEDWDSLINQLYMRSYNRNVSHNASSSKRRKANTREKVAKRDNKSHSVPEQELIGEASEQVPQFKAKKEPKEKTHYEWEEDETSSKKWMWIVGVVLLGLLVGGGYYYMNNRNEMSSSNIVQDTDSIATIDDTEIADIHSIEGIKSRLSEIITKGLHMSDEEVVNSFFSQEFKVLYSKVEKIDNTIDGPGFWNGNIWDGGQDGNPDSFTITRVSSPNSDKANAGVKFVYDKDGPHSENFVNVELIYENDDWYIDDIDANKQGMRSYIDEMNISSDEKETDSNSKISMAGKVSNYAIHMVLTINGTNVTGYYYYDSQGDGNRVTLNGELIDENMKLRKTDKGGDETGYFEGVFDGTNYEGKNVNYNRDEALPFFVEIVK